MVQAGAAVTGFGGTVTAAVATYILSNGLTFSNWTFMVSVAIAGIGLILLIIGIISPEERQKGDFSNMSQSSGSNSNNIQAGRDISLNGSHDVQD